MSHSDPIIPILAQFRPLFTAPTWKKMMTLLTGTILARGRRTVTAALWQTGHHLDSNFSQVSPGAQSSALVSFGAESAIALPLIMESFDPSRRRHRCGDRRNARTALGSQDQQTWTLPRQRPLQPQEVGEQSGLTLDRHGRSRHAALDPATLGLALSVCPGNDP